MAVLNHADVSVKDAGLNVRPSPRPSLQLSLDDLEMRLRSSGLFDLSDLVRDFSGGALRALLREHRVVLITTDYGTGFTNTEPENVSACLAKWIP